MTQHYTFDQDRRIWLRSASASIPYSDGEESENYLLLALRSAKDISSTSSEIVGLIRDWPSEYHLSPVRHNLLRPFTFKPSDQILELGCGCGSITRHLGETGATVIAVEGSQRRAQIAAERCRDLSNITVFCDNIADFSADEKFDYVTLIGVLEYAPLFIKSDDPIRACLGRALSFLKENGVLILAIENKLGLKYFSGCREDHVGVPYFGINDLYTAETPVTFGREEITHHLNRSGFGHLKFFYPFPDYKLPNLILSEQGVLSKKLNLGDLLIHSVSRDYPENHRRAFADGLAWGPLADNRLLGELANAFLICACKTAQPNQKVTWLAKTYSRSYRRPEFLVETTIKPEDGGTLVVRKQSLASRVGQDAGVDTPFRHFPVDSNYIDGRLLLRDIHIAVVRESTLTEVAATFAPWISYLLSRATLGEDGKLMLPGDFIDCAPTNLIVKEGGDVEFFDAEWICETDIPLSWVVIRGLAYSVNGCLSSRALIEMTHRQFIDTILSHLGHQLDKDDYHRAVVMDRQFSTYCHFPDRQGYSLLDILEKPLFFYSRLSDWHKTELERVKSSISWRVTAPLRVGWSLYRRLIGRMMKMNAGAK